MKVLAISYYAPPQLTPQSIQIGRQLYHLDASVHLLHGLDAQCAQGFDQYPDFYQRIISLAVPNPGPPLSGMLHRAALRAVPLYGACPDLLGPWRRHALARAMRELDVLRPEVLASFGMPMSAHLLALAIRRRAAVPWLAHFSDPWADNPFHDTSRLEHQVNLMLERRVIAEADQLLFTSQRTLELVMRKYPASWRSRAAVLPHAWDMACCAGPAPAPSATVANKRFVIRHIGACYGARSPLPLFAALGRILERSPQALDDVVFEFVGHVSPVFLDTPQFRALPPNLVHLRGQLGYAQSQHLARTAAALLVIDAPSDKESVFLPSKLVEYIGARRPVWGITPPGTSADLIAEWAGGTQACAAPNDLDAVVRMLQAGLAALDGPGVWSGPEELVRRFAPDRVSGTLRQHLRTAISRCHAMPGALARAGP